MVYPFQLMFVPLFQQYLYVHRVMLFYFFDKYKIAGSSDDLQAKYRKFVEEYDKATA